MLSGKLGEKTGQTFVFFGIVGSGKGTQVKLLTEFLEKDGVGCAYIGTGEIFRKILSSSDDNEDTKKVKEIVESGRLMPDEITNKLVWESLDSQFSVEKNLFFDGYPRTVVQAQSFEEKMSSLGRKNIKIIFIKLSQEEAMKRNLLRGRVDDTQEGLAKRFEEYEQNVIPAMNYFKDKVGYQIFTINGEQSVEDVHQDIISALGFK